MTIGSGDLTLMRQSDIEWLELVTENSEISPYDNRAYGDHWTDGDGFVCGSGEGFGNNAYGTSSVEGYGFGDSDRFYGAGGGEGSGAGETEYGGSDGCGGNFMITLEPSDDPGLRALLVMVGMLRDVSLPPVLNPLGLHPAGWGSPW